MTIENIESTNNFLKILNPFEKVNLDKTTADFEHIINLTPTLKEDNLAFTDQLSNEFYQNKLSSLNVTFHHSNLIIEEFQKIQNESQLKNKETSCDFNILKLFSINEPMHSFLLAKILNPNSEHGQGNLFLTSFLNKLGIEFPEQGQWAISAEKGRIDILLKRQNPHSVIVIENKSNFANDQPNQLYRYWYREIFYPNRHIKNYSYSKQHPEKYQVIYLTPSDWKQPNENTTLKPKEWADDLPNIMPVELKIWKFNTHIVDWLNETYKEIPKENFRLKEYVKQYIEIWE